MSSSVDITMPSLGADMSEGTLVEWQVSPGDHLDKGDIIALLETQKGIIEMEVFHPGVVTELLLEPVVTVPVGTALARMEVSDELSACAAAAGAAAADAVPTAEELPINATPVNVTPVNVTPIQARQSSATRPLASPVVRRRAAEEQIDLSILTGSGPDGAILLRDLPASMPEASAAAGTPRAIDPGDAMRAAIAAAMSKSKREIPHYYLALEVDISATQHWLDTLNAGREPEQRILLLAPLLRAIALALEKYPSLNGTYQQQSFTPSPGVHIGNVISLREGGLVVPAIHDVEQLSVEQIMTRLRDLSQRSRRGVLRSSELIGASITVSSMGERGSDLLYGVIYPPQVAILGIGRPRKALRAQGDQPVVADVVTISLAADHRVSDGITGAKFLNNLANKLQKPEKL